MAQLFRVRRGDVDKYVVAETLGDALERWRLDAQQRSVIPVSRLRTDPDGIFRVCGSHDLLFGDALNREGGVK